MTKKIYYERVGKRYKPVYEYDSDFHDAFPKGSHLISCYPGGKSVRYNVDPNYAAMIAAARLAEDAICDAVYEASKVRPASREPLTEEQKAAFQRFVDLLPETDSMKYWMSRASTREIVEAGVDAMQKEANKLMQHQAVRNAYEHFMLMCKLAKEQENA